MLKRRYRMGQLGGLSSNGNAPNRLFTVKCRLLQSSRCGVTIGWTCSQWVNRPQRRRPSEKPPEDRLDSWKEIAAYLGRDVTTVQRWEKREAMPVHRHLHDKRGSVYALPPELDAWLQSRRKELGDEPDETDKDLKPGAPVEAEDAGSSTTPRRFPIWLALAGVAVIGLLAAAYALSHGRAGMRSNPKSDLWRCCL